MMRIVVMQGGERSQWSIDGWVGGWVGGWVDEWMGG